MAKSKAQKHRQSLIKQGKLDPTIMRGSWGNVNPQTKRLPNKKKDAIMKHEEDKMLRNHFLELREQCKNFKGEVHPELIQDVVGEEII